jgi:uncharacterized protein YukE
MTDEKSDAERGGVLINNNALELIKDLNRKIDAMQDQLNELSKKFSNLHGAHNGELKNLEAVGRERYEAHRDRIVQLEQRMTEINPALIQREIQHISGKLSDLRKEIENAQGANIHQELRWDQTLTGIIKWIGGAAVVISAAILAWFLAKLKL